MKYTGRLFASGDRGTSVSMGYMAESYIDFGPILMFVPIFALGLALGLITRYLVLRTQIPLYGQAAAAVVGLGMYKFEIHNVKLVGGLLTITLFYIVWLRFAVPLIDPWLRPAGHAGPGQARAGRGNRGQLPQTREATTSLACRASTTGRLDESSGVSAAKPFKFLKLPTVEKQALAWARKGRGPVASRDVERARRIGCETAPQDAASMADGRGRVTLDDKKSGKS